MANVPDSSLWMNDNAANGNIVDQNAWNQNTQVLQSAINDNYTKIVNITNGTTALPIQVGTAYPATPVKDQLFYRTDLTQLRIYNGTAWVDTESTVNQAFNLLFSGTNYPPDTAGSANTVSVRDASGNLTANSFQGEWNGLTSSTSATASTIAERDASGNLVATSFQGNLNGHNTDTTATSNTVAVRDASGNLTATSFQGEWNGLSASTSATANTIAERDASGNLTATSFQGNLNGYAVDVNATPNTIPVRDNSGGLALSGVTVSSASNLTVGATQYPGSLSATADTVAVRDGNGDLFATKFHGDGSALTGLSSALASAQNTVVDVTGGKTVLTFTPTKNGMYSVKAYLRVITAATNVTLTVSYADSGGAQSYTPSALNAQSVAIGSHSVIAFDFEAVTGTNITVSVNAGTASQVYFTGAITEVF